jgi:hypothetical protein
MGRIEFNGGLWAELSDDGEWTSSSPTLAETLNEMYIADTSPSDGGVLPQSLKEASDDFGGTITASNFPPDLDGVVY